MLAQCTECSHLNAADGGGGLAQHAPHLLGGQPRDETKDDDVLLVAVESRERGPEAFPPIAREGAGLRIEALATRRDGRGERIGQRRLGTPRGEPQAIFPSKRTSVRRRSITAFRAIRYSHARKGCRGS